MPRLVRIQKQLTKALNDRKARRITAEQYGKRKARILEKEADLQATALAKKLARQNERDEKKRTHLVSFPITRNIRVYTKEKKGKKKATYTFAREYSTAPYTSSFAVIRLPFESQTAFQERIRIQINAQITELNSEMHHNGAEGEGETFSTYTAGDASVSSGGWDGSVMTRASPYTYEFAQFSSIANDGNCVPESLAKLYPTIGLERIHEEMGGPGPKTAEDILNWCVERDISCLGCDEDFNILVQYASRNTNRPPCYFVQKDNHFYLMDKSKGLSIMNSRSNSSKKETVKEQKELAILIQDTIDLTKENTHFIVSSVNLMRPLVKQYIEENHSVPDIQFGALDEQTLYVKSFRFGKNNKVSVNRDYALIQFCNKRMNALNKANTTMIPYSIKSKTLRELARAVFEHTNPNFPTSRLNSVLMDIFTNWKKRQHYAHLFNPYEWNNHTAGIEQTWDANKQYSSALHEMSVPWMFFNMFALPEPYSGGVKDAYYYIETTNTMPCKGNGWYSRIILQWLLDHSIEHIVLLEIKASSTLPANTFQPFVQTAMQLVPEDSDFKFKFLTNTLCGSLNTHTVQRVKGKSGANIKETVQRCITTNGHFYQLSRDITACATIHCSQVNANNMPLYAQVLDWSAIQLADAIEHLKAKGCLIRGYNTDSITFKHAQELEIDLSTSTLGGWKKETPKPYERELEPKCEDRRYDYQEPSWVSDKVETDFQDSSEIVQHLIEHGGVLSGQAGFGKSYILNGVIEKLTVEKCLVLGYTNISAHNVGGKTFHSTFKINIDNTMRYDPKAVLQGKSHLIVDEISQVPSELYGLIEQALALKMTIILAGDFAQILPIGENNINGQNALTKLICKHRITMTVYKRGDKELLDLLLNVRNRKSVEFDDAEKGSLHFCFTKKQRDYINNREMAKVKKSFMTMPSNDNLPKVYVGMPLRACKTKQTGEWLNNQRFKVVRLAISVITIQSGDKILSVPIADLIENFVPGYAMTIHSSQGLTITEPYTIWWERFTAFSPDDVWRLLYTATSRATCKAQIGVKRI